MHKTDLKRYVSYSLVPIRRHGTFILHTAFIRPNTFPKKRAMPYNWISMSSWSTFRYKFLSINLHLLYRIRHPCLLIGTIHKASCDPCLTFCTLLLIGTRRVQNSETRLLQFKFCFSQNSYFHSFNYPYQRLG